MTKQLNNKEVINTLIAIADELDKSNPVIAAEVDATINVIARKKAPLKDLEDPVKKDLMKFLTNINDRAGRSKADLTELCRRLRYFDIGDVVRELGLDKMLKEMDYTCNCADDAQKRFFELTFGRRPSKNDLTDYTKDMIEEPAPEKTDPLAFFGIEQKEESQRIK